MILSDEIRLTAALADIMREFRYSREKYGDSFDQKNTMNDWVAYISQYAGKACTYFSDADVKTRADARAKFRTMMLKVANLALCAMLAEEQGWLVERHYDGTKDPS